MQFNNFNHQPKNASVVYWAHLPEHDDMWKQGYIGITKQPVIHRWLDHIYKAKIDNQLIFARALNKYNNIVFDVIVVGQDREYCERIEAQLRPDLNIGWNINIGGDKANTLAGGMANKARLDLLKITNSYWIAKEAAKQADKERKRLYKEAVAKRKKDKEEYKANTIGQLNRKLDSRNKLGLMGVSLHPCGKYRAQYKGKSLGYFKTAEKAHECYVLTKQKWLLQKE